MTINHDSTHRVVTYQLLNYPIMTINHYSTHCVVIYLNYLNYPIMTINHYSTHCVVICQLLNSDLAEKFIEVFLCYNYLKIGYFDSNVFYDCSITILLIQQHTTFMTFAVIFTFTDSGIFL